MERKISRKSIKKEKKQEIFKAFKKITEKNGLTLSKTEIVLLVADTFSVITLYVVRPINGAQKTLLIPFLKKHENLKTDKFTKDKERGVAALMRVTVQNTHLGVDMAQSFRDLVGENLREVVDCANVEDITKTKNMFQCVCPKDMKVVAVNRCLTNRDHPCCWEVLYDYKPETGKRCSSEDSKNAFEDILKCPPFNVSVKNSDKHLIGFPLKYRVLFTVDDCKCKKLDF